MKQFLSILILTGLTLQNFSGLIIYFNFKINQEVISKTLCVKKDEPDNCCQGKCQLKKELIEENKKENQSAARNNKEKKEIRNNLFSHFAKIRLITYQDNFRYNIPIHLGKPNQTNSKVFHPPQYL
jgi:hypothetical protein